MDPSWTDSPDAEIPIEDFDKYVRNLELLLAIANRISNAAAGPENSYLAYQASLVFCKLALGVLGTLRFIPRGTYYADKVAKASDISSGSVLARQVLSDTVTFLYLADRKITEEDRSFRGFVWDLQALKQSYEFLKLNNPSNPLLLKLDPDLNERFKQFDQHPLCAKIPNGIKGLIKSGRRALWMSDYDILNGYGLSKKSYDLPFLIFSNFVHASALSTHAILQTEVGAEDSWKRFIFGVVNASAFFAFAIEVFVETFPAARSRISEPEAVFLAKYSETVRKAQNCEPT